VFFEFDKSDITPDAATILDSAVSAYANCNNAQVMLAGHADKAGTSRIQRCAVSASRRCGQGLHRLEGYHRRCDLDQGFGESMPKVETADGVRELQNRRVEITYGPGSGS
jgi:outer membrane protein OmpA-like peptidoglycan-associated protein